MLLKTGFQPTEKSIFSSLLNESWLTYRRVCASLICVSYAFCPLFKVKPVVESGQCLTSLLFVLCR